MQRNAKTLLLVAIAGACLLSVIEPAEARHRRHRPRGAQAVADRAVRSIQRTAAFTERIVGRVVARGVVAIEAALADGDVDAAEARAARSARFVNRLSDRAVSIIESLTARAVRTLEALEANQALIDEVTAAGAAATEAVNAARDAALQAVGDALSGDPGEEGGEEGGGEVPV